MNNHNIHVYSLLLILISILILTNWMLVSKASAQDAQEVKIRGRVYRAETVYHPHASKYFKEYYVGVIITEVLEDAQNIVSVGEIAYISYTEPLGLDVGDIIEAYGQYSYDLVSIIYVVQEFNANYYIKLIDRSPGIERKRGTAIVSYAEFVYEIDLSPFEKAYEYNVNVMEVSNASDERIEYYDFYYPEKLNLQVGDVVYYDGILRNITVEDSLMEGEIVFFDDKSFIKVVSSRVTIAYMPSFIIAGGKVRVNIKVENSPRGTLCLWVFPIKVLNTSSEYNYVLEPTPAYFPISGDGYYSLEVTFNFPPGDYQLTAFIIPEGWYINDTDIAQYTDFEEDISVFECYNKSENLIHYSNSKPRSFTIIFSPSYEEEVYRKPPPIEEAGVIVASSLILSSLLAYISSLNIFSQAIRFLGNLILKLMKLVKMPPWLQEGFFNYIEEWLKSMKEKEIPRPENWKFITLKELKTVVISIIVVLIVYTFVESGSISNFLNFTVFAYIAPRVLLTSILVYAINDYGEALIAKIRNIWAEVRLWPCGLFSLILTGFALRSPFASPSLTLYQYGCPWWEKVRILIFKYLMLMLSTGLFALMYIVGFRIVGDAGILICLISASFMLIPVKPYPGKILFKRRFIIWLLLFLSSFILYFTALSNILPHLVYVVAGLFSLILLLYEQVLTQGSFILRLIKAPALPPPPQIMKRFKI